MTDTVQHPEPVDLADVARAIDALRACNDRLRAAHLRAKLRDLRRADREQPFSPERDA